MASAGARIQLLVATRDGNILSIPTSLDSTVGALKQAIYAQTGHQPARQQLSVDGRALGDATALRNAGVNATTVLLLELHAAHTGAAAPAGGGALQGQNDAARLRQQAINLCNECRQSDRMQRELRVRNPGLLEKIMSNDIDEIVKFLEQVEREQKRLAALAADPMSPEAQAQIMERIQQENIQRNMELALEENPEAFGRVVMLYVNCSVNHTPLQAFVDSGAQATIMSLQCAERCGLARLIDKRFAGVAQGVGTGKIIGKIHNAKMTLGTSEFACSFTVLENCNIDFLFGLDNLMRHQCSIDLRDHVLRIGEEAVPFLAESEISKHLLEADNPSSGTADTSARGAGEGSSAPGAASASSAPGPQGDSPDREKAIKWLTEMGFDRANAEHALTIAGGNADLAASFLFEGDQ